VFTLSSRQRLTDRDLGRFPGDTLFHRLARAVCHAGCLPRKELYEAWEMARRVRRLFRGGRTVDLGGGHGLLAHVMLLLDDSSPDALVVDAALPPSSAKLHDVLVQAWPRLACRVRFVASGLDAVEIHATDLVVSSHACGALTDRVLDRAVTARARVAVLPCCHDVDTCDVGALTGWIDSPVAIDILRAIRLEQQGYRVWTQTIPAEITPKNRLLLGAPEGAREGQARRRTKPRHSTRPRVPESATSANEQAETEIEFIPDVAQDSSARRNRPVGLFDRLCTGSPAQALSPNARVVAWSRTSAGQAAACSSKRVRSPSKSARVASSKPGLLPAIADMNR
jgi:hypothetical protein